MTEKAFIAWSGGKDCCQAAYLARRQGLEIRCLLNMVNPDFERSCSHGISSRWIKMQAAAMEIPIVQPQTNGRDYEAVFIAALQRLRAEGVTTGVFGDIDFEPHLEWNKRVCGTAGIVPVLPLWQRDQERTARDFIDFGFESIIVATRADLLGEEWLGRRFDHEFLKDIAAMHKNITPCGEAGEFHSLVIDGPLFKQRLNIRESAGVRRRDHWFLDIRKMELSALPP